MAREQILKTYSREAVGPIIEAELEKIRAIEATEAPPAIEADKHAPIAKVRWEGALFSQHSLGHVNRSLCAALMDEGVEITLVPTEAQSMEVPETAPMRTLSNSCFAGLTGSADVHVRHAFPPLFARPDEGHFVLMQPWEYGFVPKEWVRKIEEMVTEVWCNSQYVIDLYRNSGVPEEKLFHIPLGVDPSILRADALPYIFTDEAGAARLSGARAKELFRFVYVGGTIERKGFDILLEAYLKAFSALDDVALIVKDTGTRTVYSDKNYKEKLLEVAADDSRPRVIYLDGDQPMRSSGVASSARPA